MLSAGLGPYRHRAQRIRWLCANAGFLSYNRDETVDQITYDGRLKLNSYGLVGDWYPSGGGFRLSVGARRDDNHIDLTGQPSSAVRIGNDVYPAALVGTVYGTVRANRFAPTVSLGYGGRLAPGLTLAADLGVLFQGTPTVDDYHATGLIASNPAFQSDLDIEKARVEDQVHRYQYWPIAQLQLLYRF